MTSTLCSYYLTELMVYQTAIISFAGSRIRSTFDFGLVTLSINGLRADDSAIYTCKATNLLGEAVSTATLKIDGSIFFLFSNPLYGFALFILSSFCYCAFRPALAVEQTSAS